MRVSESQAVALVLTKLNGHPDTGAPAQLCKLCRKPLIQVATSPGLRREAGSDLTRQAVCMNTKTRLGVPCLGALGAKSLLDILQKVAAV